MTLPAVALFDVNEPPALACLGTLARQGVAVHAYGTQSWPVARFSKYLHSYQRCPSPTDHARFSAWLRERLQRGEITRVCPSSDLIAFHCAELREYFPAEVQPSITSIEAMQCALFKPRLGRGCEAVGVGVPATREPGSLEEALVMAESLGYPLIVKPKSHIGVGSQYRGGVVHSPQGLREHFRALPAQLGGEGLLQRYPELRWPMLQQYIQGADREVFGVSGFRTAEGKVHAAASRKTDFWPALVGIGMVSETLNSPQLVDMASRVMEHFDIRGPFAIEFLRQGEHYLAIDLNPRLNGRVTLEIARGQSLPWQWYQFSRNQPLPESESRSSSTQTIRWRHGIPYLAASLTRLLRWPNRGRQLRRWLAELRQPAVSVIEGIDPLPRLVFLMVMLRHPSSLVKSYWRSRPTEPSDNEALR